MNDQFHILAASLSGPKVNNFQPRSRSLSDPESVMEAHQRSRSRCHVWTIARSCTIVLGIAISISLVAPSRLQAQDEPPPPPNTDGAQHRGPRGRGPHGGNEAGGGPRFWSRISEEDRQRVHDFLAEHFPKLFLELEHTRDLSPQRYARRMRRIVPEMWHLMDLLETNPRQGRLAIQERRIDMDMWRVARRYHATNDEKERTALRAELKNLATEMFDCRHRRRELQIGDMETRIAELKERHRHSEEVRDELIEQDVKNRLERRWSPRPDSADDDAGGSD